VVAVQPNAHSFDQVGFSQDGFDGPLGSHIDLRTKRKLELGQELIYVAGVTHSPHGQANVALSLARLCSAQIRLYVKY